MTQTTSSIHPFVLWSKIRLDEMDAAILEAEKEVTKAAENIKAGVAANLAKAKRNRNAFKARIQSSVQDAKAKGEASIQSTKQELQQQWQEFEIAMNAVGAQLNNGRKEFEARAAAQLKRCQDMIRECNDLAVGIAVEQKESVHAAITQMQDKAQNTRQVLADVRHASSESAEAYRGALQKSREAIEEAYESSTTAFAKV
jgi:hypothetical protein